MGNGSAHPWASQPRRGQWLWQCASGCLNRASGDGIAQAHGRSLLSLGLQSWIDILRFWLMTFCDLFVKAHQTGAVILILFYSCQRFKSAWNHHPPSVRESYKEGVHSGELNICHCRHFGGKNCVSFSFLDDTVCVRNCSGVFGPGFERLFGITLIWRRFKIREPGELGWLCLTPWLPCPGSTP